MAQPEAPERPTETRPECPTCQWLDAVAVRAYSDPEGVDESALADVRVLRGRHAPECENPRGGGEG
ncbi:hypothetical protein GCM10010430_42350 [Kitasatospora cystarginea]|uniref:Uncharacterized protein n=1 Tax=Kitasatospora cystarginea TaxID=58350 RepID=A0ABN3ED35_9ACTN